MYQRYANPLELLDAMIDTGRLYEFVREVINIRNEEMEDKTAWEVWLHRVFDMSWHEFRESLNDKSSTTKAAPTHERLTETVRTSAQMLMNFCPDGGGEQDGTVQTIGNDSG